MHDAVVVGSGPNGLAAAIVLARAGLLRARARGGADTRRRRHANAGADASGLPPRRLLRHPSARSRLPVPRNARARAARPRVDPAAGAAGPPVRRRNGRAPRALRRGDSAGARGRRGRLSQAHGAARRGRRRSPRRHPRPAPRSRASRAARPLRPARSPVGRRPGPPSLRRATGPAPSSPGSPRTRCFRSTSSPSAALRPRARPARPSRRLAHARAAARRRSPTRSPPTCARSAARSSSAGVSNPWPSCRRARAVLLDVTPRQLLRLAGDRLPAGYRRRLERFRYGPGVFKLDLALDGPIPWRAPECARAGHRPPRRDARGDRRVRGCGGRRADIRSGPYVLLAQQSLFDPSRAPAGQAHRLGLLPRAERLGAST